MRSLFPAGLAALCFLCPPAEAHDMAGMGAVQATGGERAKAGDLAISGGWVRATLPGQKTGAGYLAISNNGTAPDRLLSLTSPAASRVEIHSMRMENDVMIMRPVKGGLEIAPGSTVELGPGGLHLMFLALSAPFTDGSSVEVELRFARAGAVRLSLPVRRNGTSGQGM